MNSKSIFILILVFFNASSFAQRKDTTPIYISQNALNKFISKSFGNLLTGQFNGTEIGNYASLDPINGSFTFKGIIPIVLHKNIKDTGTFSYLSLKMSGDLISDSYAVLFQDSKLNTNTAIQAEYNFTLSRPIISFYTSDKANLELQRRLINKERWLALQKVKNDFETLDTRKKQEERKKILLDTELVKIQIELNKAKKDEEDVFSKLPFVKEIAYIKHKNTDSMLLRLDSLLNEQKKTDYKIDSLNNVKLLWNDTARHYDLKGFLTKQVNIIYKNKITQQELSAPLTAYHFSWFSIIAATGKKRFYTFNDNAPLGSQVSYKDLGTYKLGAAYNFYKKWNTNNQALYINSGILKIKENNTPLLQTTDVNELITFTNTPGDTTRTVSKTYHAYTDSIVDYQAWNYYLNVYFFVGNTNGFHFFPAVVKYLDAPAVTNIGFGYVASFANMAKEKPLINAEVYISFNDILKSNDNSKIPVSTRFFQRNEMGIRFTLPFTLLSK